MFNTLHLQLDAKWAHLFLQHFLDVYSLRLHLEKGHLLHQQSLDVCSLRFHLEKVHLLHQQSLDVYSLRLHLEKGHLLHQQSLDACSLRLPLERHHHLPSQCLAVCLTSSISLYQSSSFTSCIYRRRSPPQSPRASIRRTQSTLLTLTSSSSIWCKTFQASHLHLGEWVLHLPSDGYASHGQCSAEGIFTDHSLH